MLEGRVVDASLQGMRVVFDQPVSVELGVRYRLEIEPESSWVLACVAHVRHISADGIGFENFEEIPRTLIWRTGAP